MKPTTFATRAPLLSPRLLRLAAQATTFANRQPGDASDDFRLASQATSSATRTPRLSSRVSHLAAQATTFANGEPGDPSDDFRLATQATSFATRPPLLRLLCILLLALASVHTLTAQTGSARLAGRVTDPQGRVVPDAVVEIINDDTNVKTTTKTNAEGLYFVPALNPGKYRAVISKAGFKQIIQANLSLHTQDELTLNFGLQLGSASETVTVSASSGMVPISDSAAVGLLVDRTFVENMPLNGRSFQDLIALAPGAVSDNSGGGGSQGFYSINGQRSDENYFSVDGVASNLNSGSAQGVAGVLPSQTTLGTTQSLISIDALQEFKIQTSTYSAEYGRQSGGQVQLTSRSGTNEIHGTVYDYFRNEALDANSWLFNANGIPREPHRQNDFGGTVGGPLEIPKLYHGKNKTFYFISYEGLRLKLPNFVTATVPTQSLRQFASPAYQPMLNSYPKANGPDNGDQCAIALGLTFPCTAQWRAGVVNPSNIDSTSVRIDQIVGSKLQLFFRVALTPSNSGAIGGYQLGSDKETTTDDSHTWTLGASLRITDTLLNEGRFNWSTDSGEIIQTVVPLDGAVPYSPNLLAPQEYAPPGSSFETFAVFNLPGSTPGFLESPGYSRSRTTLEQYNLLDSLTWVRGQHTLKFGGDFRRLRDRIESSARYGVVPLTFSATSLQQGIADLLVVQAQQPGEPVFKNLSLYAQDSWKVGSRISLDYGLRWEFNPVPGAVDGKYPLALTSPVFATTELAPTGTPQYRSTYRAFAPRLGFAYQVNRSSQRPFVVRGGYGIFFNTAQNFGAAGYTGYPFYAENDLTNVHLPAAPPQLTPPSLDFPLVPPYPSITVNTPDLRLPYTEQWSLSLNQGLTSKNTLTASYVGNSGKRLLGQQLYDLSVINPAFTQLRVVNNAGSSHYNALQIQDQGYIGANLQIIGSYAWAHAQDNGSTDGLQLVLRPGNSDNDIRHNFNLALRYEIPAVKSRGLLEALSRGWSLSTRFTAFTGVPIDIVQSQYGVTGGSGFTTENVYPDLISGVPIVLHNVPGDPFGWALNPAAFAPVPLNPDGSPVRQGNLSRNFVHGPAFWNLTNSLQRNFSLNERFKMLFQVDAFNIFNHANAGYPDPCLCDGVAFGKVGFESSTVGVANNLYATGAARSLQLMLKMQF